MTILLVGLILPVPRLILAGVIYLAILLLLVMAMTSSWVVAEVIISRVILVTIHLKGREVMMLSMAAMAMILSLLIDCIPLMKV